MQDALALGLKEDDEQRAQFVGMVAEHSPQMQLETHSIAYMGKEAWIALGVENRTRYVVRGDMSQPAVMRIEITVPYQAWCETYVTLDRLVSATIGTVGYHE